MNILQKRDIRNVLKLVSSFIVLILGKDGIYKGPPCMLSAIIILTLLLLVLWSLAYTVTNMITKIIIILYYTSLYYIIREYIFLINKECVINTVFFILIYGNGIAWSFET